jgi:hypothetical protein
MAQGKFRMRAAMVSRQTTELEIQPEIPRHQPTRDRGQVHGLEMRKSGAFAGNGGDRRAWEPPLIGVE